MIKSILSFLRRLDQYQDMGFLILRIGIGVMFMIHGYPKLMGGVEKWSGLGSVLTDMGLGFAPTFMGFMAAISEFFGGFLLAIGLFTRTASFFLMMTMIVASLMHLTNGDSFGRASHAIESAILFLSLIILGSGKFSVDQLIRNRSSKPKEG